MTEKSLFVGNLHWVLTESDVQEWFDIWKIAGTFTLIRDRETGESRCFGFLKTADVAKAKKLNKQLLRGKLVVIRERRT